MQVQPGQRVHLVHVVAGQTGLQPGIRRRIGRGVRAGDVGGRDLMIGASVTCGNCPALVPGHAGRRQSNLLSARAAGMVEAVRTVRWNGADLLAREHPGPASFRAAFPAAAAACRAAQVAAGLYYSDSVSGVGGETGLRGCFRRTGLAGSFFGTLVVAAAAGLRSAAVRRFATAALALRGAGSFALAGAFTATLALTLAFARAAASRVFKRRLFNSSRMPAKAAVATVSCWAAGRPSIASKKACVTFFVPRGARPRTSFLVAMVYWFLSDRERMDMGAPILEHASGAAVTDALCTDASIGGLTGRL